MKYTIGWESNGKRASILWEKYEYQFLRFSKYTGSCRIFPGTNFSGFSNSMMKYIAGWKSNGKKHPSYGKSMGINFPGLPHLMGFADFSNALGNWWESPCNSHVMKYLIRWQASNGEKASILWEKYEYQFPSSSTFNGFCRIFLEANFSVFSHSMGFPAFSYAMGNWGENPCISHMIKYTTGWESNRKKHPF